jgi:hypothetical protein
MRSFDLIVEDFPPRKADRSYRCAVLRVSKSKSPVGLLVVLEDRDADHLGQRTQVLLPVPVRPEGTTADFLRACGSEVAVGRSINPRSAVGVMVGVKFGPSSAGAMVPIAFEPDSPKEPNRDKQP